jgi:hypothetical protein
MEGKIQLLQTEEKNKYSEKQCLRDTAPRRICTGVLS